MLRRPINQKVAISVVYVCAMFMSVIDITIVNVAVPTLSRDFHTSTAAIDGVVIGFLVSLSVFIPASGWLGDRFGGKNVLLVSIALFTVASALCGAANSLGELVAFRVLQGIGGGLMAPVGLAMLFRIFPPEERLRASSILIIPTAVAPALGPVLGGIFVSKVSWRWVFFINVPIGVAALIFGTLFLAGIEGHQPDRFDLTGFLLSGVGLGLTMYGISEGPAKGWDEPVVLATLVPGVLLLAVMIVFELRRRQPLLDLRLYSDGWFRPCSIVLVLASVAFFGTLYALALFMQEGLGYSAMRAGLTMLPEPIGLLIGSQLVSRVLYARWGPRAVVGLGGLLVATVIVLMSTISPHTSPWALRGYLFCLGFSISWIFMPTQSAAFHTVSPQRMGGASTLFNAQRQLGGAVGVALVTTIIAAVNPIRVVAGHAEPHLTAYRVGFLITAAGMVVAAVAALSGVRNHQERVENVDELALEALGEEAISVPPVSRLAETD